jgi:hypothetical protein
MNSNTEDSQYEHQILLNRVQCKSCGEVLVSQHRHDYVKCKCPSETFTDGGNDYQRYGGAADLSLTVYMSKDHERNRQALHWGTRGKDNKQPLKWVKIAEMSNDHLKACLETQFLMANYVRFIMETEIEYRQMNGISIED